MCGINGILRLRPAAPPIEPAELLRTRDAMALRGPDGEGAYFSPDGRIALGHRRLAILDPSPAGAQPMASADGRYRIVLNGEIYNFRALRATLPGYAWRTESDTEVLLALYARFGSDILPRLRGMFALAIWDESEKRLFLARDPLGIKPLYYTVSADGGTLRFASQVKALEAGGAVPLDVDLAGLAGFLLWGSVPEPATIRSAVRALPAGCYLTAGEGSLAEPVAYAALNPARGDGNGRDGGIAAGTAAAAEADLGAALAESVRDHLVSDVPVAVFLSAGLDSGLLLALARRADPAAAPPLAFTLSFDAFAGTPRDEAPLAAEVARRLGARHVVRRVGRDDFRALFGGAVAAMDQPSIDGFNTFVVARAAHEAGIKVALSGLGGDELMGSYPSFADVPRGALAARWGAQLPGAAALWPRLARRAAPGRPKLQGLLRHGTTLAGAYFLRRGLFLPEELPALLGAERAAAALAAYDPVADAGRALPSGAASDPWLAVQALETARYMRNQLLRDADWAAMASSLELRVPLADARLTAAFTAEGFATARRLGKAGLVRQAAPELPEALFHRPKSGFYMPVTEWLEEPDAGETAGAAMGCRSRRLARRVLAEFGIELAPAAA